MDWTWGLASSATPERIAKAATGYTWSLLSQRIDSFMFHQANAKKMTDYGGMSATSFVTYFTKVIMDHYNEYMRGLPLYSINQDEMEIRMTERLQRDTCGITGKVKFDNKDGKVIDVKIDTKKKDYCKPKLTLAKQAQAIKDVKFKNQVGGVERFGYDATYTFGDNKGYKNDPDWLQEYGGNRHTTPGDNCFSKCETEGLCEDVCGKGRGCCRKGFGPALWWKGCWGNHGCDGEHCCVDLGYVPN